MMRAVLTALCGLLAASAVADTDCDFEPRVELERLVGAHGGSATWNALRSISIERTHSFAGRDQHLEFRIDPADGRLAAVMQHWTHASQLDVWRLPPERSALLQLVIFESYTQAGGLLWPERYSAYTATGELAATGVFGPYAIDRGFDAARLVPPPGALPDASSSWLRNAGFRPAGP